MAKRLQDEASAVRDTRFRAVQACHELLLWIIPQLDKFPRARRFTLGDRLEAVLLEVLERLVEAVFSRFRVRCADKQRYVFRHRAR